MARFTAMATATETTDWEAGDFLRTDKFRDQVGQNLEFQMQSHNHDGDLGDGGTLPAVDPKWIWYMGAASGS